MAIRSCVCSGGSLETSTPVPGSEYANPGPNFEDHISRLAMPLLRLLLVTM